ncbi:hypothetical protein [Candidatus Nitrospira bockiana]
MAWGIIMTAFTLFGMLALAIGSVTMESGSIARSSARTQTSTDREMKKAA